MKWRQKYIAAGIGMTLCVSAGCGEPEPEDDVSVARAFATSMQTRRAAMVDGLRTRDNTYAEVRLERYALADGWESLPRPTIQVFDAAGTPLQFALDAWSHEALLELGERAFHGYPMQFDGRLDAIDVAPPVARQAGFFLDGRQGGVVRDGRGRYAWTCGTCHTSGPGAPGRANENLDVAALYRIAGRENSVVETWGLGRSDPTADAINNPSNIPDLRFVRHQATLHHTGAITNSFAALAARVDSLLIVSTGERERPAPEIAAAIAYYLWHLDAPHSKPPGAVPEAFERSCSRCHGDGTRGLAWVAVDEVGTDPTLTSSPSRGTGGYRVPTLRGVSRRGRLLHTGEFRSVEALLAPDRDVEDGHVFGLEFSNEERDTVLNYLHTL